VTVNVTETPVLDRTLELGAQSEQVTVQAEVGALQTANSTLGTTVGTRTLTSLPLSSRNYTQILALSAGANVGATNATQFGKGTQTMSVNGNDPGQNNFQMDGVNITNWANAGNSDDSILYTGIGIPSPDAIQEFKVQTSTYDASYGRNPGANVNVVTKSGSNQFHGTAFEFFRNAQLNANDFFYNRDSCSSYTGSCPKQVLNQNQFGGVIGGPVKKDNLFFFGSYEGTRQKNGVAGLHDCVFAADSGRRPKRARVCGCAGCGELPGQSSGQFQLWNLRRPERGLQRVEHQPRGPQDSQSQTGGRQLLHSQFGHFGLSAGELQPAFHLQ
jgi:hypothetical protein